MTYVIYLDRYHLGDPLFLGRLGRALSRLDEPCVLVHGPGEDGERLLEAEGGVTAWRDGMLVVGSDAEHGIVERAARDLNRRIAHALNDAGVAAVRVDGASRGLLTTDDAGTVECSGVSWLAELVGQGVIPVVAALVPSESGAMRQVSAGAVAGSLAAALPDGIPVFLVRGSLPEGPDDLRRRGLSDDLVPEPEVLDAALTVGPRVLLSTPRGIGEAGLEAVSLRS